ncbi:MAG TPA: hypothetical protein P5531_12715 [Bacteroidales bacterium]|nr:hypothetical protein [Bacteroidales bacterium]HSA44445.1 hypothetical protein [Bacteroidales bacterium]
MRGQKPPKQAEGEVIGGERLPFFLFLKKTTDKNDVQLKENVHTFSGTKRSLNKQFGAEAEKQVKKLHKLV